MFFCSQIVQKNWKEHAKDDKERRKIMALSNYFSRNRGNLAWWCLSWGCGIQSERETMLNISISRYFIHLIMDFVNRINGNFGRHNSIERRNT